VAGAVVLFTYYNPILRMGEELFAEAAARAGIDGVLVTDLPLEEGGDLRARLIARGIDPILLVAPTTGPARLAATSREARGFVYYISRTGVTGARAELSETLGREVTGMRSAVSLPIAVGFGISKPEQVSAVAAFADGVVIGSALVAVVEQAVREGAAMEAPDRLERTARDLFGPCASSSEGQDIDLLEP
jgi:tryptophan synthase alpha chain